MPAPAPTAATDDAGGDSEGDISVLHSGAQSSNPEEGENGADTPATAALPTAAGQPPSNEWVRDCQRGLG